MLVSREEGLWWCSAWVVRDEEAGSECEGDGYLIEVPLRLPTSIKTMCFTVSYLLGLPMHVLHWDHPDLDSTVNADCSSITYNYVVGLGLDSNPLLVY